MYDFLILYSVSFFVYSGTIFVVRQVGILRKKELDNYGIGRYNRANEDRFLELAILL